MAAATFLQIGDFHAGPGPRNADRYRSLEQILAEAPAQLDAWFWPGDLSHARQTIEDKNRLAHALMKMAARAPVILCYGNHDLSGDLDVFASLGSRYPIAVVDRPECIRLQLPRRQWLTAFVLPYPNRARLVASGVVPAEVVQVGGDLLEPIFLRAALELEKAREAGDITVALGHVNVAGSIISNGQPNIGREIELATRHLDRLGGVFVGLNHIHKAQTIAGAYYAGSICPLDWGEIDPKRYLVIEYENHEDYVVKSCPLNVAPLHHLEGELTREAFILDESPVEPIPDLDRWVGREVRVRYRYRQSERALLDEGLVRAPFVKALRLKVEPVAVPDRAVRAPAVAAALTLADKVAAWGDVVGVTPTPFLLERLASLEHGDDETVLGELRARLSAMEDRMEVAA